MTREGVPCWLLEKMSESIVSEIQFGKEAMVTAPKIVSIANLISKRVKGLK
jgi:hypothetical protein